MQPSISFPCNSSSSWICIGVFRPSRLTAAHSSEELVDRLTSISLSFNRFAAKTAVLKSRTSNHVGIFSVWERGRTLDLVEPCKQQKVRPLRRLLRSVHGSLSRRSINDAYPITLPLLLVDAYEKALSAVCRVVHLSWYEVSCWDHKEMRTPPVLSTSPISTSLSSPPPVQGDAERWSLPLPIPAPMDLSHTDSFSNHTEDTSLPSTSYGLPISRHGDDSKSSFSSPHLSHVPSSSSLPSRSSTLPPTVHLSLGDIVHLRYILGNHRAHLQDALSYSCLAILKAYFPQTEGLLSYTFYRSLDGSRMAGFGVWQGVDAASTFLNAPDGACEERYWRSMGAKARFEIYEVAALVA